MTNDSESGKISPDSPIRVRKYTKHAESKNILSAGTREVSRNSTPSFFDKRFPWGQPPDPR